jgi:hypothetical protein
MQFHFIIILIVLLVADVGCKRFDSKQVRDGGPGGWGAINIHCPVPIDVASVSACLESDPEIGPALSAFNNEVIEDSIILPSGRNVRVWKRGRWAVDLDGNVYSMTILG